MAQATARSLFGLGHDLTDDELVTLTATENRPALKVFLAERAKLMWRSISYDQGLGLVPLIKRALGERNAANFNTDITQERFRLKGPSMRSVKCRVEAYLDGETSEQAAKRLTDAGHILASTGDLAEFLHTYPEEVERWSGWVFAISEDSQWSRPDGCVCVPSACVAGTRPDFNLLVFQNQLDSRYGVLVLGE